MHPVGHRVAHCAASRASRPQIAHLPARHTENKSRTTPSSQVQCLAVDAQGRLLLTGDESGAICARFLCHARDDSTGVDHGCTLRSQALEGEGRARICAGGGSAKVLQGAHEGGVLAMSHVRGDAGGSAEDIKSSSMLFVSGGIGELPAWPVWRGRRDGTPERTDGLAHQLHLSKIAAVIAGTAVKILTKHLHD